MIPLALPGLEVGKVVAATESGFDGESLVCCYRFINQVEHETPGTKCFALGIEWREALGQEVCVDEALTIVNLGEKFSGEGCFSCSVGTGDDDGGGSGHGIVVNPRS